MDSWRRIRLRYPSVCCACSVGLAAGSYAHWNGPAKRAACLRCGPTHGVVAAAAGGSAQREADRRQAAYERRIRKEHPRIGGVLLKVRKKPASTRSWEKGAQGERILGGLLDVARSETIAVLHDRRILGSRANIDHIVIAASGIYVIDAKHYTGQVRCRDVGGWFRNDRRLYVGRRDCSKLVAGMARQVEAVRAALHAAELPIVPVLCFVNGDWSFSSKPFEIDGVAIMWPKALMERIEADGPITPEGIAEWSATSCVQGSLAVAQAGAKWKRGQVAEITARRHGKRGEPSSRSFSSTAVRCRCKSDALGNAPSIEEKALR